MSASASVQSPAGRPPLPRADARLRLAVAGSVLLHGVAVGWMLGAGEPPVRVAEVRPVQAVILTAVRPPPAVPAVETPEPPPVAVLDDSAPAAQPLPPQRRIEPKPQPRQEIAEPLPEPVENPPVQTPPEIETAATAQPEAAPAVTAPRFEADYLDNPPPAYPRLSRRLREEGEVELRVRVDAAGRAVTVELARSSGSARLDQAALHAVRNWRFEPARRGRQAVEAWVRVPILFKLEA